MGGTGAANHDVTMTQFIKEVIHIDRFTAENVGQFDSPLHCPAGNGYLRYPALFRCFGNQASRLAGPDDQETRITKVADDLGRKVHSYRADGKGILAYAGFLTHAASGANRPLEKMAEIYQKKGATKDAVAHHLSLGQIFIGQHIMDRAEMDEVGRQVMWLIEEAVAYAAASPVPAPEDALDDVYSS